MTAREGGTGGGTGFLFGNIDKRGRLDEDYMDDDAKDTIDNVGSKVVEKDRDLREITEALPQKRVPGTGSDDEDEDYDDEVAANPEASSRVDYYDEQEEILEDEMDDKEREDMAAVALRNAEKVAKGKSAEDEDEDYDEDDEGDAPATDPAKQPSTAPVPEKASAPAASSPRLKSQSNDTKPAVGAVDTALAEQRRLMAEARLMAAKSSPEFDAQGAAVQLGDDATGDEMEDEPVHFSRMFTKPTSRLSFTPRRRRLGLVVAQPPPAPTAETDDGDVLDREHKPELDDPVQVVLALDASNAALRAPERGRKSAPVPKSNSELMEGVDMDEYNDAAAPLEASDDADDGKKEKGVEAEENFAMVQQVAWEDEIKWRDSEEADEDDDWYVSGDESMPPAKKDFANGVKPASIEEDAEDEDEDEFEEPVVVNAAKPDADKSKQSDSEDEMEWEDGMDSTPKNVEEVSKSPSASAKKTGRDPEDASRDKAPTQNQTSLPGSQTKPGTSGLKFGLRSVPEKDKGEAKQQKQTAPAKFLFRSQPAPAPKREPPMKLSKEIIAPNKDLEEGTWLEDILWDSLSESEEASKAVNMRPSKDLSINVKGLQRRFGKLILDMNDPNMIFEHLSDDPEKKTASPPKIAHVNDTQVMKAKMSDLTRSTGTLVHQLLEKDRYNISNDIYYASGTSNFLKVDRRSILRGLQNAPPAVKCLTTRTVPTEAELLSYRRPVLSKEDLPSKRFAIQTFRRKRPKGGNAQIAGQIPKKKSELFCSEKDAFRVSIYEYALERQPCILPVPGMASRIVTYARKDSAAAAAQALKDAAGTPDADTVFMSPDEPPPLHAGDIEADGEPLSVVESHLFAAPCTKSTTPTTDFLLVRNGKNMYVREIDSVMSLGVTEPKVEIMAPNTERFKKYSRERALLWVIREFTRMRKDLAKQQKGEKKTSKDSTGPAPSIQKDAILQEFVRRRTYPEASLMRMVKEFARYHNGKFTMVEDPSKSLAVREAEVLRTVTPQETAAFEAMESGWENLLDRGIQIFTHPSNQGNIIAAAERSGLGAGPAVGAYIKSQLSKSPWFRSQNIISAQKQLRKELLQVLSLARIVNDLKEGGATMESRLMSLTAAEMNNVLTNQYRVNSRKIPADVEERRVMVREMAQRKGKPNATDVSNYALLIKNVIKKHRNAGVAKAGSTAGQGATSSGGNFLGLSLEQQREALEHGNVADLPAEEEDIAADINVAAALAANGEDAFGRIPSPKPGAKGSAVKRNGQVSKQPKGKASAAPIEKESENAQEKEELNKLLNSTTANPKAPNPPAGNQGEDHKKKPKKKVTKLKVKKKVTDADGKQTSVVTTVTDPAEIARILERNKGGKKAAADGPSTSQGGLKIAINLRQLQPGSASGVKKKSAGGTEKKKVSKKPPTNPAASSGSLSIQKVPGEKGQIGKIKISTKQLRKEKEQAALKRKRSQYGDDIEYRAKKATKTSRRKRNGTVQLNNILERVEKVVRESEGYVAKSDPIKINRLKDGESPPPGVLANNLAVPKGTGLDFTAPVDTKLVPAYKSVVKKPMYLNLIKQKCKRMAYHSVTEFRSDMELIVKNAKAFNQSPDVQWVVQHAELLLEIAVEQLSRKADEIRAAEEMIKLEKAEAKASGAASSSSKSKAKRSAEKKALNGKKNHGSDKRRKGLSGEVVVVPDGSDKESEPPPSASLPVIDLSEDQPGLDDHASGASPMPSPALPFTPNAAESSPPASSPLPDASPQGAGITDDIYALAVEGTDVAGQDAESLVLNL